MAHISEFTYTLPPERIAEFPLEQRDRSKLLIYKKGVIAHKQFTSLPAELPENSTLFFNNTRVLPARLFFNKKTGARIELFLLEPVSPETELARAMSVTGFAVWKCMIGNLKKWKDETLILRLPGENQSVQLTAELLDREKGYVKLSWNSDDTFAGVVQAAGRLPLPPYIKRELVPADYERYQTVYARLDGAVAAPTAGLHFTEPVLHEIRERGIKTEELTLHVSAGTFQPVKAGEIKEHQMHAEQIVVTRENIKCIRESVTKIAVGTTSMRTLESLYWYGARLVKQPDAPFLVYQNDPYLITDTPSLSDALEAILRRMEREKTDMLTGKTEIFIYPGYNFRICQGLITNFHLPGSTLIVLIAAFTGADWKKIYQEALENDYRFLSYGDSSLLLP